MIRRLRALVAVLLLLPFPFAVADDLNPDPMNIIMSTSMEASGIGPYLRAAYKADTGRDVRAIITGSGQAFAAVRFGTIDVVMTHEPEGTARLYDSGYTARPRPFMANGFILVGPSDDPASLKRAATLERAFALMRKGEVKFVSRGDDSGTHKQEVKLWARTGDTPNHKNYIRAGIGMAGALRMADQLHAYTLTEPGSFLTAGRDLDLIEIVADDPDAENRYEISVTRDADARAQEFADWLLGPLGQGHIANFTIGDLRPFRPVRKPLNQR